jgi:flagellar assembly protein FliH
MACKVIHPNTSDASIAPIAWPMLGGTAVQRRVAAGAVSSSGPESEALRARIAEFEQELQRRTKQAFQEGEQAGARQAAARLEPVAEKLARTIEELSALRARFRKEAERDVVKLAIAIARRVLRREFTVDPAVLLGIVKSALEAIDQRELHKVRMNPEQAKIIEPAIRKLQLPPSVQIVQDAALPPGSAIFETSRGELDASIETQLEEIDRGLADFEGAR